MTAEEFTTEADAVITPAVERLVYLAFQTVPQERVHRLLAAYFEIMKKCAVETARSIIADAQEGTLRE